jgi:uncharacterized protein YcbX
MPSVSCFSITPVKGLALLHPDEVHLGAEGVAENRRFFLVDERGRLFSGLRYGALVRVVPSFDAAEDRLALAFPDGEVVEGAVEVGDHVETDFYDRPVRSRLVVGPWSDALSAYVGKPLRLVKTNRPGDACDVHKLTLVSDASVVELGRRAGRENPDGRRFRMLIGLAGCEPHEEDTWNGRALRMGEASVRVLGPVPRCATTEQSPATGERDLETLRIVKGYRGMRGKQIDFGVYGEVEEPGRVRVGDSVEPA